MSVRRRKWVGKDGQIKERWIVDIEATLPDGSKLRVRKPPLLNTKEAARKLEHQLKEDIASGRYRRGKGEASEDQQQQKPIPTVQEFALDDFLAYARTNNKGSEVESKRSIIKRYIVPLLGKHRLDQVATEIEPFKVDLKRYKVKRGGALRELSKKRINNILICLSKLLHYAAERGIISSAPKVRMLKLPPVKIDFLDFEEYESLLQAAASEPEFYTMMVMAGDAGLRVGELLGLDWKDVDFEAGTLTVRRSIWNGHEVPPKSGKERTIPLSDRLRAALQGHRHVGPHVFCKRDGTRRSQKSLRGPRIRICKRAGLRQIGWHTLRHTFCTRLAMRGASPKAIQELAGHTSINVTMRYMHWNQAAAKAAIDLLNQPAQNGTRAAHGKETNRAA